MYKSKSSCHINIFGQLLFLINKVLSKQSIFYNNKQMFKLLTPVQINQKMNSLRRTRTTNPPITIAKKINSFLYSKGFMIKNSFNIFKNKFTPETDTNY
jgi:hypothetical protein